MFDSTQALEEADRLLDRALAGEFALPDSPAAIDATDAIGRVESIRRKAAALGVELHAELDRSQVFRADGHASAKAMTRHVGRLSPGEAAARERGARMQRTLPLVAGAMAAGTFGVDQFRLLARVHANPRVRLAMVDAQDFFLGRARHLSLIDFERVVREWERLTDTDGPEPANTRTHDNRSASLLQDHSDLSWQLVGSFGAMQGASMHDIYTHYVDAERLADWEKARAEHGDAATESQLPRTEAQRRADAMWQLFQDAAQPTAVPPGFVHDIVWSAEAYEEMLSRLEGEQPRPHEPDTYRCETIDGVPLEPTEAAASSLVQQMRRVVTDAAGVVIDLGRARRFTGGARTAVLLADEHCPWPGCAVPSTHCEIDHTHDHAKGGRTDPSNGGPFCGRHNRWKQKGFRVWRDPTGQWHIHRPDGTEIE